MIELTKLSSEDLIERTKDLKVDITDHSNIGSIHLKANGVYANLQLPTLITPETKTSMLLKFNSFEDKAAFTFDLLELKEQVSVLTDPTKYDRNYIYFKEQDCYQVFIRNGVVTYLTEEEVMGLYAIFNKLKKSL